MKINSGINLNPEYLANTKDLKKTKQAKNVDKATVTQKNELEAKVDTKLESGKEATYKNPKQSKVDIDQVNRLIERNNKQMENFKSLIRTLITKQGGTVEKALSGDFLVKIDAATRAEAKEAISEDGEFGVKKTSERIVSFAKAISGGDPSKLDILKKAIQKGFDAAEEILGEELPEVSKETHKEVMRQLDEWANSFKD